MKKILKTAIILLTICMLVFSFTGCNIMNILEAPDIIARITAFQIALNTTPRVAAVIALNFAPAAETEYRDQVETNAFWDSQFDPDSSFTFDVTNTLDFDAVEATMTEVYSGETLATSDVTFKMFKDDDGTWLIEELHIDGAEIVKLAQPE